MLLCIYCQKNSFNAGNGSEEHAILSSLGGKKASRNICCQQCNNKLGDEIDKSFSEEYAFFSTMLNITTGRNKCAPTHKDAVEHHGLALDIKPGGQFQLSKPMVLLNDRSDGTSSISITAGTEQQALFLIENILKRYGKSLDDFQSIDAKSVRSYVPTQRKKLSCGGQKQFRAVAKMLLTYLATLISPERLRSGVFDLVIAFIDGRNKTFTGASLGSRIVIPDIPRLSNICHRAIIITSREKRLAIGVFELFGNIKFTVELSSMWDGPDIAKIYSIDPIDQISDEREFEIDLSSAFADYDTYIPDTHSIFAGIENIVNTFQKRQSNQQISSIVNSAIEKHIVGKGEVITQEMISNVAFEVASNFLSFIQRSDSEETIKLK